MLRLMSGHTLNKVTRNRDIIKGSDSKRESFKVFMTVCWWTGNEDKKLEIRGFKKKRGKFKMTWREGVEKDVKNPNLHVKMIDDWNEGRRRIHACDWFIFVYVVVPNFLD